MESIRKIFPDPYFSRPRKSLYSADRAESSKNTKGDHKMKTERMNQANELAIEIEELEAKIAPDQAATFLD
jgi:hypothetical protein